jgi:mannose-6-phosphate isomerase
MREGRSRLIIKLQNDARDYAWGSLDLLSDVLGYPATGLPMAEVWFGTHPGSHAKLADDSSTTLHHAIGHNLDFMIKFLAADFPLSIQVHPNELQAYAGFLAEDASGIAIDHPDRNFKDKSPKREAIVAVTEFDLLAGLRPLEKIQATMFELAEAVSEGPASLLHRYAALAASSEGHRPLLGDILAGEHSSPMQLELLGEIAAIAKNREASELIDYPLLALMSEKFGADRGLLLALTMRRFKIAPGSAVFVETGVPHCYLSGLGVEILSSSDNVLRGGLTSKHVSAPDFMAMLDISASLKTAPQQATQLVNGLSRFNFGPIEFSLHKISVSGSNLLIDFNLPGESILVCTAGELAVSNSLEERVVIRRGEAAYLSADAKFSSISGSGDGYLGSSVTP